MRCPVTFLQHSKAAIKLIAPNLKIIHAIGFLFFITQMQYHGIKVIATGVYFGIYEEGIYMVKVILTEIRHFECPNQKI